MTSNLARLFIGILILMLAAETGMLHYQAMQMNRLIVAIEADFETGPVATKMPNCAAPRVIPNDNKPWPPMIREQ